MSVARKATTGPGTTRGRSKAAQPKSAARRGSATSAAKGRTPVSSPPIAAPATTRIANRMLWIILGSLVVLDVVLGVVVIVR